MSRRRGAEKRQILPDFKYQSTEISKFINVIMEKGKKTIASNILYNSLENSANKAAIDPLELFETALHNVKPLIEVRSRRVGGATYQVPTDVRPGRSVALALRWLKRAALQRSSGRTMEEKLAGELLDAYNNKGAAVKKREETHKMAESNMAFAHFAFVGNKKKSTNN
jgi:small subunit ribosomal protein S7